MATFRLPNRGARYTLSYLDLIGQQENLARRELHDLRVTDPNPVYVAHLAART
jgi:hypothetical protein